MSTPSISSYDWIREIKPELKQLDDIPLTGSAPPFPWDQLSTRLAQAFERESIQVVPGEIAWRSRDQLYEGLGDSPFPLNFAIPSLQGNVCWVMPEQEMSNLESLLLTKETHPISFKDPSLSEAFYRFLALEVLYHISQVNFDKSIAPILTSQINLPNEDSLCWDISVTIRQQTLWGRLIISPELRRSWVEHFAKLGSPSTLMQTMAQKIDVTIHLEVGRTLLSLKEWTQAKLGDWIILDNSTLSPEDIKKGSITFTINGKPAFKGELQNNQIKVLEFSAYQEVYTPMAKNDHNENEEEGLEDFSEIEDEEDLEEDTFDMDEDFLDEDEAFEEEEGEEVPPPSTATATLPPKKEEIKKTTAAPVQAPRKEEAGQPIRPEDIPVSLVVEIGRVHMTMEKLLSLEPGNLLELEVHPEDGVDLVVNGKIVGKGELVRLGDSLGVRILDLGS